MKDSQKQWVYNKLSAVEKIKLWYITDGKNLMDRLADVIAKDNKAYVYKIKKK